MCPGCDDIQHVARTKGLQLFCVGGGALWMRASSQQLFPRCDFFETVHVLSPCPHCTKLLWDLSTYLSHYSELELCGNGTETQSPILSPARQSPHAVTGFTGKVQNFTSLFFFCIISSIPIVYFWKKKFLEETPLLWLQQSPFTDWVLILEKVKQFEDYGKSLFLTSDWPLKCFHYIYVL